MRQSPLSLRSDPIDELSLLHLAINIDTIVMKREPRITKLSCKIPRPDTTGLRNSRTA